MIFKYTTFFNYYADPQNLISNQSLYDVYYYGVNKRKEPNSKPLPLYHIEHNGLLLYVSWNLATGDLFFSMPQKHDGKYWDDHFHFVYDYEFDNVYRNNKLVPMVSFAKTIQIPNKGKDNRTHKCNFRDSEEDLEKLPEIICTNHKVFSTIKQALSPNDLDIFKEILSRPFIQTATGGNKKYKGRKIRIGPKGGKYVIINGSKKYI
jgi:hypothetical protein